MPIQRMPISVRFALRPPKKKNAYSNPHPLQVWISVNGHRDRIGAVYPPVTGSKLVVDPKQWNVDGQCSSRRNDEVNRQITALKALVENLFREQSQVSYPRGASIESVVYELKTGQRPLFDPQTGWQTGSLTITGITPHTPFLEAYTLRKAQISAGHGLKPTRQQAIDIGRWQRGVNLLKDYERARKTPIPVCGKITLTWLRDYHRWLQTQQSKKQANPISAGMASRYIGKVGKVLAWLVDDEVLEINNVAKVSWPRYADKEVHYLEPEQVAVLFTRKWRGTRGDVLWWFLLMCSTGLDYPDAVAYAARRSDYERVGPEGLKLVGNRLKPPHESFDVPLLDEVHWLFAAQPGGARQLTEGTVNRYTDQIQTTLGIEWRITAKTARKTFGGLMLANGYYINEVSRMLGHSRISTTEKHYVRVIGTAVDRGRSRVGNSNILTKMIDKQ